MAKGTRLTALRIAREKTPGHYGDGGGLYLQVANGGSKSWVFRYRVDGRLREMGLGSAATVTLAEARELAESKRKLRAAGLDPIAEARAAKAKAAGAKTFAQVAALYIESHRAGWENAKHASQWGATLQKYAFPSIGELPVASIETEHVLAILKPIWATKSETASRVRGRIESILAYATVQKWREGVNPAQWKGHLDHLLPKRSDVADVEHHAAMAFADVPEFIKHLRERRATAALALEFAVLTAARSGEVLGALWPEIDFENAVWTVPAARMKAGREHRVPLSARAIEILREVEKLRRLDVEAGQGEGDFVFPGQRVGNPLSNMGMAMLLRRMGLEDVTVHGFRSSFRDWCGEMTNYPREIAEAALAHVVGDKAEQAYRRGDALERRRAMMAAWADFCGGQASGNVVALRRA